MEIRRYRTSDCEQMADLFYHTVHTVNARDYSDEQLDAWAAKDMDFADWDRSFGLHVTLVAVIDGEIVGFGDMDDTGYLDRLYVRCDCIRQGIGTALCDRLEKGKEKIRTYASITARPFFEKRGYVVIRENQVERKGILLTNFLMEKRKSGTHLLT